MVNWNRVFRKNAASNQLAYFQISIFMRYEKSMNKIVKPLLLLLKCWKITAVYVWTNERNSQWKMLEKNIAFDWCFFWWKALQWSIFWQSHNKQHWMTLESAPVFVCACGHCHHSTEQFKVSNAHTHTYKQAKYYSRVDLYHKLCTKLCLICPKKSDKRQGVVQSIILICLNFEAKILLKKSNWLKFHT